MGINKSDGGTPRLAGDFRLIVLIDCPMLSGHQGWGSDAVVSP